MFSVFGKLTVSRKILAFLLILQTQNYFQTKMYLNTYQKKKYKKFYDLKIT